MAPGSSPPPCHSLAWFSVAPNSTPQLCCVNSQLVRLLPVGIFKHFMFISVIVKYSRIAMEIALYMNSVLLLLLSSTLIISSIFLRFVVLQQSSMKIKVNHSFLLRVLLLSYLTKHYTETQSVKYFWIQIKSY